MTLGRVYGNPLTLERWFSWNHVYTLSEKFSWKHNCVAVREETRQRHATIEVSKLHDVDSIGKLSAAIGVGGCQQAEAKFDSAWLLTR